jgi:ATP-dependent helicase/nuclease subunit B
MKCPYSYFIAYNLKAKERKLYEIQPIDYGNLFHDILESFSKLVNVSDKKWRELQIDEINTLVNECVEDVVKLDKNEILMNSDKNKYAIKNIKRLSSRSIWALTEHIKLGSFEPFGSEVSFSENGPINCITIKINDERKITLTGRIDRIDIYDDNNNKYVKIMDYKSGNMQFNIDDLYFGTQLQLILYMDSFIKNCEKILGKDSITSEVLPGGMFYFNIKDPILEINDDLDKDEIEELLLQSFKMTGIALTDVVSRIDNTIDTSSVVIPVKLKKDGSFSESSSIADVAKFNEIREFAIGKTKEIGENIFKGRIDVLPFKKGTETACTYCPYDAICMFQINDNNIKYNVIKKQK